MEPEKSTKVLSLRFNYFEKEVRIVFRYYPDCGEWRIIVYSPDDQKEIDVSSLKKMGLVAGMLSSKFAESAEPMFFYDRFYVQLLEARCRLAERLLGKCCRGMNIP